MDLGIKRGQSPAAEASEVQRETVQQRFESSEGGSRRVRDLFRAWSLSSIRSADDDGIIWIDPRCVDRCCGSKRPHYHLTEKGWLRRLLDVVPLVPRLSLGGNWDLRSERIADKDKYRRLQDFVCKLDQPEQSLWYQYLLGILKEQGTASHKHVRMESEQDIKLFFRNYAVPLVQSLRADGYRYRKGDEVGSIAIGRDGTVYKVGGATHRFYLARLIGLHSVPVRVAFVHRDWLRANGLTLLPADRHRLLASLRRLAGSLPFRPDGAAGED